MARPRSGLAITACLCIFLAACGGGEDAPPPAAGSVVPAATTAPVASAGPDRTAAGGTNVTLSGSGTAPGGAGALTFIWTQTAGDPVTIIDADRATASFVAPLVAPDTQQQLTFRLTVTSSDGLGDSDEVQVTVVPQSDIVTISGVIEYERPPHQDACAGLDFNNLSTLPIRGATVQLIDDSSQAPLQTTTSDATGRYQFANVDGEQRVFVRVRAELKRSGTPSWDVEIRNNTSMTTLPLEDRPVYVMDGLVDSANGVDQVRNLLARTGWDTAVAGFANPRVAAPFAILDSVYRAMQSILSVEPAAGFAPLDVFWSVNNSSAASGDVDNGDLGTSYYFNNGIYLLGKEGDDIEEFDDMVIAHEWGHYFEDNFSRSDSIGGLHSRYDRLDMRVAFGEGFATAFAGIALGKALYCDVFWSGRGLVGFGIDLESENTDPGIGSRDSRGWYSEFSVMKILYDLWDSADDGADAGSIGFAPLYSILTGPQASSAAFTSAFSFFEALKLSLAPPENDLVNALLTGEDIQSAGIDAWGTTETNDAGSTDALPVYTTVVPNGVPVNVCSSAEFDAVGSASTGNKLNTHRFLRVDLPVANRYTFRMEADAATLAMLPADDPANERDQSDPDMYFFRSGAIQNRCLDLSCSDVEGTSGAANVESFTTQSVLQPGTYVVDFVDWRFKDRETSPDYPGRTCFDISVTPAP